jgi:NAD(P)-dependent dehydrogenase (short-subunit alcohol dehydrogenase family)
MHNIVITGANSGLGLALTTLCLERGDTVFACVGPFPTKDIDSIKPKYSGRLFTVDLDLMSEKSIIDAATAIAQKTKSIDLLVNNAGMGSGRDTLEQVNLNDLTNLYLVNAAGPLVFVRYLMPLLEAESGATIINITSESGAVNPPHHKGGIYGYAASKAAANCITGHHAMWLKEKNIIAIAMHPGWMRTRMGGESAPLDPRISGEGILKVADKITMDDSGKFFVYTGEEHHW